MLKVTLWQLRKNLGAGSGQDPSWDSEAVCSSDAAQRSSRTLAVLFVFLVTLAFGFLGLRLIYSESVASDRVFFQATSALGAVGLSMDLTGPHRPTAAKVIEIVLMIAGRLEIMALLLAPAVLAGRLRPIQIKGTVLDAEEKSEQ